MNEPEKPKKSWGCLQLIVVIVTLFFSGLYWMSGMADMGDLHDGADLSLDALWRCTPEGWGQELPGWFEPTADHETLITAQAELPEEQRSVVHLHMWEEMTFREIGELLGQSTQTIASRYRYI